MPKVVLIIVVIVMFFWLIDDPQGLGQLIGGFVNGVITVAESIVDGLKNAGH